MEGAGTQYYREHSTEGTAWDVYQTAYRTGCKTTILVGYKPSWPMLKEEDYHNCRVPCERHRLQEMKPDIEAILQTYARGSRGHEDLEIANTFKNIWYEGSFQEKLTR